MKIILTFTIIIFAFINSFAQTSGGGFSENSNLRAREVLQSSVKAFGGLDAVKQARNFSLTVKGTNHNLFQGDDPEGTFENWKVDRNIIYQSDKQRLFHEWKLTDVNSPYVWHVRNVIRNGEGFDIIVHENWLMKMRNPSLRNFSDIYRYLPQNIISDAWESNSSLRFLGEAVVEGKKQNVIFVRLTTGQMFNLFLDSQTNLLTKYDWLFTYNVLGDTVGEVYYREYKKFNGTMIPNSRISFQNKIVRNEIFFSNVKFNPQVDDKIFEISPNLISLNTIEPKTKVIKLADGVYLIKELAGGFNVMFVEFKDFVLVVETPEENIVNGISAESVSLIKKNVRSKPIKYAVLTHHHGDHSAGARAFMSEGATIITTKGNLKYINRLAKANFTFAPDLYAGNPIPYKVEVVENNKKIISDETQTVEIYEFAPLMHVKEMLIIYLPRHKILFQSDMFNPIDTASKNIPEDDPWHGVNKANTSDLYDKIQELGLGVEKIVGSHGRVSSMNELTEAVRKIKAGN